jgi:exonuclease III
VVRLISWNVARRAQALVGQAAAAGAREPDVLALQEVTARTRPLWAAACATLGLPHVRCSLDDADPARRPAGPRRHGVLLASRGPLEPAAALAVPWPESALAARTGGLEVHVVHVPNAANGLIKPETLAAMRSGLAERRDDPVVACGDWNTPRRELPDGTVWSFARDGKGRLREERAGFWDEAELGVVPGLADLGYADAFRCLHGYASREPSWAWRHGGGWRLDHVMCSAALEPVAATYHHAWRLQGLSDHSALEVDLSLRSSRSTDGR